MACIAVPYSTSANPDSWVVLVDNPLQIEVQVACVTAITVSPF